MELTLLTDDTIIYVKKFNRIYEKNLLKQSECSEAVGYEINTKINYISIY